MYTNSITGANLVLPVGIEPTSTALQTAAMTTSAKAAWCSHRELNSEFILTKDVLYHLTMRAWCIDKGLNLGPSPCKGAALPLSYQCKNIWVEPGNRTLSTCFTDKCATTTLGTTLRIWSGRGDSNSSLEVWKTAVLTVNTTPAREMYRCFYKQ